MKKLLLVMFTLGAVAVASAQSSDHGRVQNRGHNDYNSVRGNQGNSHSNYNNGYNNGHNNGYNYQQQKHIVTRGHQSTIIASNPHGRKNVVHMQRDARGHKKGHGY